MVYISFADSGHEGIIFKILNLPRITSVTGVLALESPSFTDSAFVDAVFFVDFLALVGWEECAFCTSLCLATLASLYFSTLLSGTHSSQLKCVYDHAESNIRECYTYFLFQPA